MAAQPGGDDALAFGDRDDSCVLRCRAVSFVALPTRPSRQCLKQTVLPVHFSQSCIVHNIILGHGGQWSELPGKFKLARLRAGGDVAKLTHAELNPNPHTANDQLISAKVYALTRLFFIAGGLLGGNGLFFRLLDAAGFGLFL